MALGRAIVARARRKELGGDDIQRGSRSINGRADGGSTARDLVTLVGSSPLERGSHPALRDAFASMVTGDAALALASGGREGQALIRVQRSAQHTTEQVAPTIAAIAHVGKKRGLLNSIEAGAYPLRKRAVEKGARLRKGNTPSMPSKPLQRLTKLSKDVHAFVETNAATLANDASKIIAKGAPSATKIPALGTLLSQLSDAMQRAVSAASTADRRLDDESADVAPEIEKRDALVSEVREKLVRFRAVIETSHGPAAVRKLGFVGSTPEDPDQLVETTRAVLESLKSVALGPALDGVTVDTGKLTRGISAANEALAAASTQVRKEGREVQAARVLRDAEQREAERQVRGLALLLEGLCVLAGQDALAERVRPATRQSAVESDPIEPEPTPPA